MADCENDHYRPGDCWQRTRDGWRVPFRACPGGHPLRDRLRLHRRGLGWTAQWYGLLWSAEVELACGNGHTPSLREVIEEMLGEDTDTGKAGEEAIVDEQEMEEEKAQLVAPEPLEVIGETPETPAAEEKPETRSAVRGAG